MLKLCLFRYKASGFLLILTLLNISTIFVFGYLLFLRRERKNTPVNVIIKTSTLLLFSGSD